MTGKHRALEAISASLRDVTSLRDFIAAVDVGTITASLLHPAEDIGSALKGGVNVCQRQPVNEVFWPLVTKFVRNSGREARHLYSAAPMPAFSASRPSNALDIMPSDIS